jgi:hypothetical protein
VSRQRSAHVADAVQPRAREKNDGIGAAIGVAIRCVAWLEQHVAVHKQLQTWCEVSACEVRSTRGRGGTCGMRCANASVSAANSSGTKAVMSTQCLAVSSAKTSDSNFCGHGVTSRGGSGTDRSRDLKKGGGDNAAADCHGVAWEHLPDWLGGESRR